jgi:hypothetical protein
MANWWDAAPLAETKATPAAGANWWEAAPLAQAASPAGDPRAAGIDIRPVGAPPTKPDRGVIDAGARGVAQGLTANFGDEIRGLVEASGAKPDEPASLGKLLSGAAKYWTGDAKAKEAYDAAVARERELTKTAEEQHPIASTVGNIAGAVALPIGAAGQAATLPGRMAAGAGVGAILGGAAGAGEGQGAADTLSRAAMGAGVGGIVGGGAPAVIKGVELAASGAGKALQPIVNGYRGFQDPEGEAARRVVSSIARDYKGGGPGLAGAEYRAAQAEGLPVTVMDLGGETTRALARSAANTSPEGRAVLNRTIDDRFEGQGPRLTDFLNKTFHYPNAQAQQEAIDAVEKTANRAGYAKAYHVGDRDIMSPELERLLGSPAVGDAMKAAVERGKNRAVVQGYGAFNPAVTIENGVVRFNKKPNGAPAYPNLQLWDYTYRELRDAAQTAFRAGRNEEGSAISSLSKSLRSELDNMVPEFGQARGVAATFFKAENALEAGQKFVTENFGNREARVALAKMSQGERQLFQDGFASRFIESLDKVGDRRNVLNQIAQSPAAREKLNIALGPQKASELEARLRVEGLMDLARGALQGNSTTARQLVEAGLAGGAGYGIATGDWNPRNVFTAAFVGGVARGAASKANTKIDQRVAKSVADMLTSSDPKVLQRGVTIVAKQPIFLNALRRADNAISRVSGEQAGAVPALQSPGIARADNQPDVPRPSGQ